MGAVRVSLDAVSEHPEVGSVPHLTLLLSLRDHCHCSRLQAECAVITTNSNIISTVTSGCQPVGCLPTWLTQTLAFLLMSTRLYLVITRAQERLCGNFDKPSFTHTVADASGE